MPFKSRAQRRYFYATNPKMARKWERHTSKRKRLPERKTKRRRRTRHGRRTR